MSVLQRAWYALIRKRVRSIVLGAFVVVVLICLNVCIGMLSATEHISSHVARASHASLSLGLHNEADTFTERDVQAVLNTVEPERLTAQLRTTATLISATPVLERQLIERTDIDVASLPQIALYGSNDIERHTLFRSSAFTLMDGRFPMPQERHVLMVHEDFARHNKLSCGMTLRMKSGENAQPYSFTIVGIFSGKRQERFTGAPSDLSENTMFTSFEDAQHVRAENTSSAGSDTTPIDAANTTPISGSSAASISGSNVAQGEDSASLHQTSPEHTSTVAAGGARMTSLDIAPAPYQTLEQLKAQLMDLPLDFSRFTLRDSGAAFESIHSSVDAVSLLVRIVLAAVLLGSFVVLLLVLVLWLRERIAEIGILLSIGNSKRTICAQVLLEMILLSLPSALIAFVCVHFFAQSIVAHVLGFAQSFDEHAPSTFDAGSAVVGNSVAAYNPLESLFMQQSSAISPFIVALSAYVLALVVIAAAVGVSSVIFMRKKPRELLVQMS